MPVIDRNPCFDLIFEVYICHGWNRVIQNLWYYGVGWKDGQERYYLPYLKKFWPESNAQ